MRVAVGCTDSEESSFGERVSPCDESRHDGGYGEDQHEIDAPRAPLMSTHHSSRPHRAAWGLGVSESLVSEEPHRWTAVTHT